MKKELPYIKADKGAEDKYRLSESICFTWYDPPEWAWDMLPNTPYCNDEGCLAKLAFEDATGVTMRAIKLVVHAGFHFAVSVAPNFKKALAGACLHDWLYKYRKGIVLWSGRKDRDVLRFADYWFLSQMHSCKFLLKRTYFYFVRTFGYWFTTLFN